MPKISNASWFAPTKEEPRASLHPGFISKEVQDRQEHSTLASRNAPHSSRENKSKMQNGRGSTGPSAVFRALDMHSRRRLRTPVHTPADSHRGEFCVEMH